MHDTYVPSFRSLDEQPSDNLSETPGHNADFYAVMAVVNQLFSSNNFLKKRAEKSTLGAWHI